MQDLYQQIIGFLRGMWHRRWIGLGVAWAVAIIAVAVVSRIPEKYEASARVYVDTESLLRPLLAGLAIQPNLDQQVSLMSRTLISRPNVEKLVRMADLDLGTRTNAEREELVDQITKSIQLGGNVAANLYVISYRDSDPNKAKKVVQSLLQIFVESSLGDKRQDTQTAVKFLDDQIKSYEKNLRGHGEQDQGIQDQVHGHRGEAAGLFCAGDPAQHGDRPGPPGPARAPSRRAIRTRRSWQATNPYTAPDLSESTATEAVPEIDNRIAALKGDLDYLLRKYTERAPRRDRHQATDRPAAKTSGRP